MDGVGRSWTFPVFLLQNEFADRSPLDEDDLPPNGGNPHPFNGDVLPGDPEWVQHWADEEMLQGAFPVDLALDENPHLIHVLNPPAEVDDAWEAWPAQLPQEQAVEQQQEAVSVQMSGVSNQHTSESIGTSKAVHSPPVSPECSFPRPQITAVYKRWARQSTSAAQLPSAGPPTADPSSLELLANPTVEDFAQASVAAQVTTDELLRDPTVDTQIVPVAAILAVDNAET
ncbi:hypothetical protein GUJ93_ZPchr0009g2173 [Zizania palustris]|uniref:Uncharacterized protein n=1 Tax=Zizania palustris TaxID=103762 RepID=A0A8J5VIJ5_ZIZPA|nr:hypothetical protein GUJ93_ZPchr0009g2173 [Zizania palustris]